MTPSLAPVSVPPHPVSVSHAPASPSQAPVSLSPPPVQDEGRQLRRQFAARVELVVFSAIVAFVVYALPGVLAKILFAAIGAGVIVAMAKAPGGTLDDKLRDE